MYYIKGLTLKTFNREGFLKNIKPGDTLILEKDTKQNRIIQISKNKLRFVDATKRNDIAYYSRIKGIGCSIFIMFVAIGMTIMLFLDYKKQQSN